MIHCTKFLTKKVTVIFFCISQNKNIYMVMIETKANYFFWIKVFYSDYIQVYEKTRIIPYDSYESNNAFNFAYIKLNEKSNKMQQHDSNFLDIHFIFFFY